MGTSNTGTGDWNRGGDTSTGSSMGVRGSEMLHQAGRKLDPHDTTSGYPTNRNVCGADDSGRGIPGTGSYGTTGTGSSDWNRGSSATSGMPGEAGDYARRQEEEMNRGDKNVCGADDSGRGIHGAGSYGTTGAGISDRQQNVGTMNRGGYDTSDRRTGPTDPNYTGSYGTPAGPPASGMGSSDWDRGNVRDTTATSARPTARRTGDTYESTGRKEAAYDTSMGATGGSDLNRTRAPGDPNVPSGPLKPGPSSGQKLEKPSMGEKIVSSM